MDSNLRVPYSFISEVHPHIKGEPAEQDLIDLETEYVKIPHGHGKKMKFDKVIYASDSSSSDSDDDENLFPKLHGRHKRSKKWKVIPLDKYPHDPLHKPYEFGVHTGPPVSDRYFFQHSSSEMLPKNAQLPAMAPGTRKSRAYKTHYWKQKPHWRHEHYANDSSSEFVTASDRRNEVMFRFLGHVALAIALIVCFAMLTGARKRN